VKYISIFAIFFITLITTLSLHAQTEAFPSMDPDPQAYAYARLATNGSYSWQDLARVSLWASGAQDEGAYYARIARGVEELHASSLPASPREQGEYLLSFIHERFFSAYSGNQTRIDTLLTNGRYNCVSSAVFYMIFAVSLGLNVQGVVTQDHAFITLNTGSETIDVESTNPYGFDPGTRHDFQDNFGNVTGFAYTPPTNYRNRASISQIELVSVIMTNRLSMELRNNERAGLTVALNRAALLSGYSGPKPPAQLFLDPHEDMMLRLLSFGNTFLRSGKEEDALRWFLLIDDRYPADERTQESIYTALNNLFIKLINGSRIADARRLLNESTSHLSTAGIAKLDAMLNDAELNSVLQQLMNEQNWLEGIKLLEATIARNGRNTQLDNKLRVFRSNRVAELHNTFAGLFNAGEYEKAGAFLQEALKEFPNERQLLQDKTTFDRAMR
jgi:tetratricopeptide (TPR) repeat protein